MSAPTSPILTETYMLHRKHEHIYPILKKIKIKKIMAYFGYVDILIIYDQNKTNIEQTLNKFNNLLQPSIKFTVEKELHEEINFLDLTIHCKDKMLKF
jgi:hypothetical protein